MKFRCERDSLFEALSLAGRAVGGRGASPVVLSGLLLQCEGNVLTVTGTDLDLTIVARQEAVGIDDGATVAPARLLAEIVRSLEPGAVTLVANESRVEISAARSRFELRSFPVVEFPVVATGTNHLVEFSPTTMAHVLRQVVRAASHDDARPLLTGVLMAPEDGGLRVVATDSYRLALADVEGATDRAPLEEPLLIPARALSEVQRLLAGTSAEKGDRERDVDVLGVSVGSHEVTFHCRKVEVSTRLLEGHYPDYKQLIPPSYPNLLDTGKEALLAALRRVRLLVRDTTTPVRLSMRSGGVDLTVVSQEVGEASESVDGDFSGEELSIAFNPSYLIEGIEAVTGDEVVIETAEPSRPATVRGVTGDGYRYLLMPVRVS